MQVVADTNSALDPGPVQVESRIVDQCEVREFRTKRGGTSHTYVVRMEGALLAQGSGEPVLGVSRAMCDAAVSGSTITVEVMPGRWGIPWYRRIRAGDVEWRSPALD